MVIRNYKNRFLYLRQLKMNYQQELKDKKESTSLDSELDDGIKETKNNLTPVTKPAFLKKKRKYVSRKHKQKFLEQLAHIKDMEKKITISNCNDNENYTEKSPDNNIKQNNSMNPILVSYLLNMVQQRRNNIFMSFSPVSSNHCI